MMQKARLEYTDFSAGITENFVPGKENAYQRADNLLITRDKHLESRPGSRVLGDALYQLPTGYNRAASLIAYHNEENLFAISGKELFYVNSGNTWTTLKGPLGGSAFNSNLLTSQTNWAEWRKHLFLVPDGGDGPMMVYPDGTGTFQLRQAGLPKPVISATFSTTQLLTAAITLAVATKTAMLAHAGDTTAHVVAHASMAAALTALVAPITISDLLTYVGVLKTQYNAHITDAQLNTTTGPQVYHINLQALPGTGTFTYSAGHYSTLNVLASTALATPIEINSCVATLNDIRNRFNFHTYSTLTHKNAITSYTSEGTYADNVTGYGSNQILLPPVASNTVTIDGLDVHYPVFSGGVGSLLAYVNQIKTEFNTHLLAGGHNNPDTLNTIVAPNATDLLSAYVILGHLEFYYWWHYQDASANNVNGIPNFSFAFTGIATNGSATLTSANLGVTGAISRYLVNLEYFSGPSLWNGILLNLFGTPNPVVKTVSANMGALTVLLDTVVTQNGSAFPKGLALTTCQFHLGGIDTSPASLTAPPLYSLRVASFDYSLNPQNLPTLVTHAQTILALIKGHEISGWTLGEVNGISVYLAPTTQTSVPYAPHYSLQAGTLWPEAPITVGGQVLSNADATNYLNPAVGFGPTLGSVLYTLVWRYDYTVGTILFSDESTPAQESQLYVSQSPKNSPPLTGAAYSTVLSGLPVLVNATGQNWDTPNIFLDIYRTVLNGTSFFKVGQVTNGTTTFTDAVADIDLPSGENLYTTGGVVANDQPPNCKYITILNSTAYYGAITDITSGEYFPNRILQSIPDDPKGAPTTFTDDLDDDLMGLGNFNSYVIAFCKTSILRLDGKFDELGNGAIIHQEISKTAGCISHKSIVATELGLFFCGTGGIFWTDGYKILKLTTELDKTYATYTASPTQKTATFGTYDKINRRVYFALKSNPTTAECDVVWVLDLNWGMSEKMPFTTMSGGANFTPTALAFYQGQLLRADAGGYVFKYDPSYKSDPLIDPTVAATSWLEQPVIWDFISCATNFGTSQAKKWVTRVTVQGKNRSNLSLAISSKNDDGKAGFKSLVPIRSRLNPRWGDYTIKWNDQPACFWKYNGMIDDFRRFPAGTMRCDWKTIRMTNAFVIIANSDYADSTGYLTGGGD